MLELQDLSCVIESKLEPTIVFFRDDDVGWAAERLSPLCRCFANHSIPLDLAVIPGAIDQSAAAAIETLYDEFAPLLHLHQHGYAHANHQQNGRKCEFGAARSEAHQARDIAAGKERLAGLFGQRIEPIFTPPWNRCTDITADVLRKQGFQVLSCTESSPDGAAAALRELPVTVDWQKKRNGERLTRRDFLVYASQQFIEHDIVGVMLHHEHMDDDELSFFDDFLHLLSQSSNIVFRSMLEIAGDMRAESIAQ